MLVYIQWARGATPQDWEVFDMTKTNDWRSLPKRDEPFSGMVGTVDIVHPEYGVQTAPDATHATADDPGWINDMSVAGIMMSGADHLHVDRLGPRVALTRWNDDAEWVALGDRYAQQWSFGMPVTDTELGIVQPDVRLTVWAESQARRDLYTGQFSGRPPARTSVVVNDWSAWTAPGPANMVRHGIWLTDEQVAAHEAAKTFTPGFTGWASLTGT